jgi:hypothetical protein
MIPATATVWDGTTEKACTLTVWTISTIGPTQQRLVVEPAVAPTDGGKTPAPSEKPIQP